MPKSKRKHFRALVTDTSLFTTLDKIQAVSRFDLSRPSSDRPTPLTDYDFARTKLGQVPSEAEDHFYENFQPWLQQKLGVTSVTSWTKLIMLSCHDEKAGFYKFFQLLDEFMAQSGQKAA